MPTPAHRPITRFGLQINSFTFPGVPEEERFERIAQIAGTADRSGFDSLWVMDHFYQISVNGARTEPMLEAYSLLAAIAARTEHAQLGTMVTGVTYRNPALLAKTVTTLDVISSGRAILGIGAAWNDDEHAGYGFEFPPLRERFERLEEAVQICRAMFTQEAPSFEGRHYRIAGALNFPRPVRPGGPPILIGGSGERRTIPLLARLRRRVQLLRRRRHDPAQAGRARPRLRAGRPRSGRDHEDAPRRGRDRRRHRPRPSARPDGWPRSETSIPSASARRSSSATRAQSPSRSTPSWRRGWTGC